MGGSKQISEVFFCENSKKKSAWGVGLGGQGGCEQRIEVFVKIQKKFGGGGGSRRGVRFGVSGWMYTKN